MSVATENPVLLTDGDSAFLRVNNRLPAHALEPGVAAAAVNQRFEQGQAWPRLGIATDAWGQPYGRTGQWLEWIVGEGQVELEIDPHWPAGTRVRFDSTANLPAELQPGVDYYVVATSGQQPPFMFTVHLTRAAALAGTGALSLSAGTGTLTVRAFGPRTLAYRRFSDPTTDTDNGILLTDDVRDGAGEDGGRGRAWRILSGNGPQEIPLNGHDLWDQCRLVQCDLAMMLLRATGGQKQRYYFSAAAAADATNDRITLNVTPPWPLNTGRRVRFELDSVGAAIYGTSPPAPGNYYYAKHISGDKIELYTASDLANKLDYDASPAPVGRFFIEEAIDPEPFFGNGAANLLMQPGPAGETPFEMGFDWVLDNVEITDTDATTELITAPNHRFQPGDSVTGTAISGVTWGSGLFAAPQSKHTLRLYDTLAHAQIDDGTTGLVNLTADNETGSIWKTSAAKVPLPPCREGCYESGRFLGINGKDLAIVSDPYDFLHVTVFTSVVPANQGEAGQANWILPLGDDVVAIGKDLKVIGIAGFATTSAANWRERTITAEYNGIAPLAAVPIGTDIWFAARKGFASIVRTVAGETLGVSRAVSRDIPQDLLDIDWTAARLMCAETWNNRLFWAVPTKAQQPPVQNNKVLVYHFTNQNLRVRQDVVAGDIVGGAYEQTSVYQDSWEGTWTGDLLTPHSFARLGVNGEERLSFATPEAMVCWFHDGWDDAGAEIATELLTRAYFGGRPVLALKGKLNWDTFRSSLTASLLTAGVSEEETLAGLEDKTYDRTAYTVDGREPYDPSTATPETFNASHRADYSPTPEELLAARADLHQNTTETFRCRARGVAPQIRIANTQGSARIGPLSVQARPVGVRATSET